MFKVFQSWAERYLSDPDAVLLLVVIVASFLVLVLFGNILLPVLISVVIAYLLQWWVKQLEQYNVPHSVAYISVYIGFLALFTVTLFLLLPLLWRQCTNLFIELPTMVQTAKQTLNELILSKDFFLTEQHIDTLTSGLMHDVQNWGRQAVTISLSSIPGVITWVVYLVLVPFLVFFFLKDHQKMIAWAKTFLPSKHTLIQKIWSEMDIQIGNYIRGKLTEIMIVGTFTYAVFWYYDMRYQFLLAALVALSVVIPYIGAVVVTIPVVLVGYMQWGFTGTFAWMLFMYFVVQFIDGNIVVPLLFSEAVNLHPVAIILAILVFGSFWGFWGVFFAIPLATFVKAVMNSWPRSS